jgi:hypothetical protein
VRERLCKELRSRRRASDKTTLPSWLACDVRMNGTAGAAQGPSAYPPSREMEKAGLEVVEVEVGAAHG